MRIKPHELEDLKRAADPVRDHALLMALEDLEDFRHFINRVAARQSGGPDFGPPGPTNWRYKMSYDTEYRREILEWAESRRTR